MLPHPHFHCLPPPRSNEISNIVSFAALAQSPFRPIKSSLRHPSPRSNGVLTKVAPLGPVPIWSPIGSKGLSPSVYRVCPHRSATACPHYLRAEGQQIDIVANVGKRTISVPAVFNHEPGATTSRFARLTRSPLPLAQSLPALARVIVVRVNPVLAGLRRLARHESAQARHENLYHLSSMARKCCRGFIERASRREGLVDLNDLLLESQD